MSGEPRDPVALHRQNNAVLTGDDVLVPAYPGSGHAFLGNVLLELGLNYSDPYTEFFGTSGRSTPISDVESYRKRLAATAVASTTTACNSSFRFVKTHLYPIEFPIRPRGIVLLVRDPRDAVHSYYRWRLGFSEEGEQGSFEEFLDRPGINGLVPVEDWTQFSETWLSMRGEVSYFIVLRFEDLKRDGGEALQPLISTFTPSLDHAYVARALEASSFDAMRAHEDNVSCRGDKRRIMRRGKVEEWREWFNGPLAHRFRNLHLRDTAAKFGYADWPKEH